MNKKRLVPILLLASMLLGVAAFAVYNYRTQIPWSNRQYIHPRDKTLDGFVSYQDYLIHSGSYNDTKKQMYKTWDDDMDFTAELTVVADLDDYWNTFDVTICVHGIEEATVTLLSPTHTFTIPANSQGDITYFVSYDCKDFQDISGTAYIMWTVDLSGA